ncbi:hypothetical protein RCH12_003131 [Cryobacterium sp. MP_3.1]|uniref:hypothetical protein n=1 Tax=Cryobacterium sp. MP_3.1 TaxID=3071711 RepID=UPI002E0520BC|nr:hypothetical protein [Cryobacterium sp. MP_3.1]
MHPALTSKKNSQIASSNQTKGVPTMEKKTKLVGGSVAIIALALAGGLSLTGAALATPSAPTSTHSVVSDGDGETADDAGTEVEDGTNDGETADDTGTEVEDGTNDGETADDTGTESTTEDTSDDINGVAVEDGTQD